MGMTSVYSRAKTPAQLFEAEIRNVLSGEVLDYASYRSVIYAAVRYSDGHVGAVVVLTRKRRNQPEWTYTIITENEGPHETRRCPLRILKLLSPTQHKYAQEWREKCYAQFNKGAIA